MNGLRPAKVVKVHGNGYAVDLVYLDTGARVPMVQVLSPSASTNTGSVDLPDPTPGAKAGDVADTKDRDIFAMVGFVGGLPVVLGFLFPQVCQMLFDAANFKVERHASDWYTTVDKDGNFEASHPSGTYIRIATDPDHVDLTGTDFDGKWAITKNTDKDVHLQVVLANGGDQKAKLHIDPAGNGTVELAGNLGLAVEGDITSSADSWAHTGNITVTGTVTASVDVVGGGKHLKTHVHTSASPGSPTSPPT